MVKYLRQVRCTTPDECSLTDKREDVQMLRFSLVFCADDDMLSEIDDGNDEEENAGLSYAERAALKEKKRAQAKKRQQERAAQKRLEKLSKETPPEEATGLCAALYEYLRCLLGIPRQASDHDPTSIKGIRDHQLPARPTPLEIDTWTSRDSQRRDYIKLAVENKVNDHKANHPRCKPSQEEAIRKMATEEAAKMFDLANRVPRFQTRIRSENSAVVSYKAEWLSRAEAAFSRIAWPRITADWPNALTTPWNVTFMNTILVSFAECYRCGGIPGTFTIPASLDVPKWSEFYLQRWLSNKRSKFYQDQKDNEALATTQGTQELFQKKKNDKEKVAEKKAKSKVTFALLCPSTFYILHPMPTQFFHSLPPRATKQFLSISRHIQQSSACFSKMMTSIQILSKSTNPLLDSRRSRFNGEILN